MGIAAARQRHQRAGHRRDQALGTVRLGVGRARLKALIELYSERMNTEGMAIELAIRQWGALRSGRGGGGRTGRCGAAQICRTALRAAGLEADDADAQAFLFYCFVCGQSLLVLDRGQRRWAQLIANSAEKLLDGKI